MNQKTKKDNEKTQMTLWRVLDYTSTRQTNSQNSDKKDNSQPSRRLAEHINTKTNFIF